MIKRIIPYAHKLVEETITKTDIVIDATCGNGHDTLFLSKIANHVFAFDIQKEAIENTKRLLIEHNITNVTLIHDSHISFSKHDIHNPKVIMYNLGYLPGSNQEIKTKADNTITSIQDGLRILKPHGLISITVYPGHKEGLEESKALEDFVSSLPSSHFNVLLYKMVNKHKSPYNIFIEKIR